MSRGCSKLCAFALALVLMPGMGEVLESAVHLVAEGHLAHAAPHGDEHGPSGPEHGCTPIFHACGCHASLAFVGPPASPILGLRVAAFAPSQLLILRQPGFRPSLERPPRV